VARWTALACVAASFAGFAPVAQAGWSKPFEFAKPGTLDYLPAQLAFSANGGSAAAFGIEDVDTPGSSQAYLTSRSPGGALGVPLQIGGAQQILALSFDGGALELLTGASPAGQSCCSSAQAIQLSARGQLGRARTLVGGLTGDTLGQLLTLGDGQMLATVATERGVWVVQSSRGNRFATPHRVSGVRQEPESMAAAWLGGERTIVAWTAGTGTAGATSARSIDVAIGSRTSAPGHARVALTVASGHEIDELGVARRGSTATLAWIESWFDRQGDYHSEVRAADLSAHPRIRTLSPANRLASGLSFAAGSAGDQGVAWQSCTVNASCTVQSAVRGAQAAFAGVSSLGASDPSESPAVSVGPRGQVLVGWVKGGRPTASVGSASRRRFGLAQALSSSTYAADLTVAFGPRSQALAAWTQGTLNPSVVGAAYR
jgi:hypothetical protein